MKAPSGGGIHTRANVRMVEAKTKLSNMARTTGIKNELATFKVKKTAKIKRPVNATERTLNGSKTVASSRISGCSLVSALDSSSNSSLTARDNSMMLSRLPSGNLLERARQLFIE